MKQIELEVPEGSSRIVLLRDGRLVRTEDSQKYHFEIKNGYAYVTIEDDDEHEYSVMDRDLYMRIRAPGDITFAMLFQRVAGVAESLEDEGGAWAETKIKATINGKTIDLNKDNFQMGDDGHFYIDT